jgi:hypothetical protein
MGVNGLREMDCRGLLHGITMWVGPEFKVALVAVHI